MSVEEWYAIGSIVGLVAQMAFVVGMVICLSIVFRRIAELRKNLQIQQERIAAITCLLRMKNYGDPCICGYHMSGIDPH